MTTLWDELKPHLDNSQAQFDAYRAYQRYLRAIRGLDPPMAREDFQRAVYLIREALESEKRT